MTDEIDTSYPERIWARVEPDWHEGITGENFVGGMFDAGHFRDGVPYVLADLYEDERQRAEKAEASDAESIAMYQQARRRAEKERARAEKAEAALKNLVTRGPFIGRRLGHEPGLRQLLLNYYGDSFSAMKAAEYAEKYIAALRQDDGDDE